ncbi:hypothetical protein REPUB_Repub02eG0248200 [Reevesia pubescens]
MATLEHTPTWAPATVCVVFISISIAIEYSIRLLPNWLKRRRKHALSDAMEKLKSELMLLGFISFLFAGSQSPISDICIPPKIANTMLPCRKKQVNQSKITKFQAYDQQYIESKNDGILWKIHRQLVDETVATFSDPCSSKGKVSFMTRKGMEQLQQFIFVLAVMQIVSSFLTLAFGRAKKCFFRQFFNPVAKVDYLTLRHGFISAHFSGRYSNFNFQDYLERSLDEDFKIVVGISPLMWFIVVIFMLVDVYGWHVFLWLSFIPLPVVLILGTKLEVIVARMALQINNQNTVIRGTPLVQPNDELFWFRRPRFVLTLLHYTLFTNAFELAFFIWVSMGSEFKTPILEDHPITKIMKQWHSGVRERRKNEELLQSPPASLSRELSSKTDSPAEIFPSFRLTSLTLSESIQLSNRGEITGEQDNIVEVEEASSSGGPP